MRKRISFVLVLVLCFTLLPAHAFAAQPDKMAIVTKTDAAGDRIYRAGDAMLVEDYQADKAFLLDAEGHQMTAAYPAEGGVPLYYDAVSGLIYHIAEGYLNTGGKLVWSVEQLEKEAAAIFSGDHPELSGITAQIRQLGVMQGGLATVDFYVYGKLSDGSSRGTLLACVLDGKQGIVYHRAGYDDPATGQYVEVYIGEPGEGLVFCREATRDPDTSDLKCLYAAFLDAQGTETVPLSVPDPMSADYWPYSESMARVKVNGANYGYLDREGNLAIPAEFGYAYDFQGGYAAVSADPVTKEFMKYGYIDKTGQAVIPLDAWDLARGSTCDTFAVGEKRGGEGNRFGVIDKEGNKIVPFEYDWIDEPVGNVYFALKDKAVYRIEIVDRTVEHLFADVPEGAWYAKYLQKAYDSGIIAGMSADTYGPQRNLTAAQILVMAANLHSLQKGDAYDFQAAKQPGTHWGQVFADYCKAEGIVDERFDDILDQNVDRGQMAYVFANTLRAESYQQKKTASFSDTEDSPYAADIQRLGEADIVGGYADGTFRPEALVTRAEAAVFISNILDAME
jgi:hypothetical protein